MNRLIIEHLCSDSEKRPMVSYKIREYIEQFIMKEVLVKYDIINRYKYNVTLFIIFSPDSDTKNDAEYLILNPRTIKEQQMKTYSIFVPFNIIRYPNSIDAYLEVLLNAICFFLEKTYKNLKHFDFEQLYKNVDMEYVRSFPYPAEFSEQRFIGDNTLVKKVEMSTTLTGMVYKEIIIKKRE